MKSPNSVDEQDKKNLFSAVDESLKKAIQKHIVDFLFNHVSIDLCYYENNDHYTVHATLVFDDEKGQKIQTLNQGYSLTINKPQNLIR